jgi:hypothetical protein
MSSDKAYSVELRLAALVNQAGPRAANTSITDVTATGIKTLDSLSVPGGTAAADVWYDGDAYGQITNGVSAPTNVSFYLYWGGTGGTQLCLFSIPAAGLVASASALGWHLRWGLDWQSATEATGWMEIFWHTGSGPANSQPWLFTFDITGLSTSSSMNLTLAASYTGGSGSTIHTFASHIRRRG